MQQSRELRFLEQSQDIFMTKVMRQHWKNTRYSYRDTPRPDWGLMLLLHGQARVETEDRVLSVKVGDVLFLPKGAFYDAVFEGVAEDYLVNFDTPETPEGVFAPTVLLQNATLDCSEAFAALLEERLSDEPSALRIRGLLYLLLDSIVAGGTAARAQIAEQAKELLKSEDDLTVAQIAKRLGCSESGLRRTFKEETGLSPVEYRLRYRLERAKYLLESTNQSITQIAELLHIYDAAYFCKMFKKQTGLSPAQYARKKRL